MESTSLRTAFYDEEEEAAADYRDADRKEVWYDALENAQRRRGESLPSYEQQLQKRVAMRMGLLGEQPLDDWVTELQNLVCKELWLEDAYQALRWHVIQHSPWMAEHDRPEGEEFDGPGLLWDALEEDIDLGSTEESRFWDIYDYRMGMHVYADGREVSKDMTHLVTREWELEQTYQHLLSSIHPQPTRQAEPDLPSCNWEDLPAIPPASLPTPKVGNFIDWFWEDLPMAGGDGTEVSPPALQRCWAVGPDPKRQPEFQGVETVGLTPQQQCVVKREETTDLSPQPQGDSTPNSDGADGTAVSAPGLPGCWTAGSDPPPTLQECQEEEVSDSSSPQPICNKVLGIGFPDHIPAEELASGQSAVGLCPPLSSSPEPDFPQATPAEELASGQSAVGLCPPSTYSSKLENHKEARSSRCPLNSWGHTEQSQAPKFNRSSIGLWVDCQTNSGTDRREVRYLVSLPWEGEMCGETNLATVFWRGLFASLLPQDYGPY